MHEPTPPTSPYSAADRQRWKQLMLAKGSEINAKLVELLAGKEVDLQKLGLQKDDEPAETPERRLRGFFDLVMRRMRAVEHPQFGFDAERGAFVTVAELDETPWLDLEPR